MGTVYRSKTDAWLVLLLAAAMVVSLTLRLQSSPRDLHQRGGSLQ
jgi:hypothetical protein